MITQDEVSRAKDTLIRQMGEILADLDVFDTQIKMRQGCPCSWNDPLLADIRNSENTLRDLQAEYAKL